jgi:hypothetical protein
MKNVTISTTTINLINKVKQGKVSKTHLIQRIAVTLQKNYSSTTAKNIIGSILRKYNID